MNFWQPAKTIAVFAHPGHELRCFGFLQHFAAEVLYISDASASSGKSRLSQSESLLQHNGLNIPSNELAVSDAKIYSALINQDRVWLLDFYQKLCRNLCAARPDLIITDAAEGYNPVHDLCHFLTMAAARACKFSGKIMATPLTRHPHDLDGFDISDCMMLDLDPDQVETKTAAINAYTTVAGGQLADEAKAMEEEFGPKVHGREVLCPVMSLSCYFDKYSDNRPYFEEYGEQRVQSNKYDQILRLRPHLAFALELLSELPECEF